MEKARSVGTRKASPKKMRWTAKDDRTLLLFAKSRIIDAKEYKFISKYLTIKPSSEAVQRRLEALRDEQIVKLENVGILDEKPLSEIQKALSRKRSTADGEKAAVSDGTESSSPVAEPKQGAEGTVTFDDLVNVSTASEEQAPQHEWDLL